MIISAMEFTNLLTGFLAILRESQEACFKNKRQMASITILILLLHSLLLLFNYLLLRPRIYSLISREIMVLTSPNSSEFANLLLSMVYDLQDLVKVEALFILLTSIISLLSSITIIVASSIAYAGQALNAKNLSSTIAKSWRRPVVTWFYITLLDFGYICIGILLLLPFSFNIRPQYSAFWAKAYFAIATFLYVYQAMVWTLALVVSVVEERCGLEALGKAGQLVKGSRVMGFLLKFLFACVPLVFIMSWKYIDIRHSETYVIVIIVVELVLTCVIKMLGLMAFTVFYHVCKKSHGEEVELLPETSEYTKPSYNPLLSQMDLP